MKPHVSLNCAASLDGVIGRPGVRLRLSNDADRRRVHRMRAGSDAIMVGVNTVLADDPHLTVKYSEGRNPVRVVVDSRARTPLHSRVLDNSSRTVIAVSENAPERRRSRLSGKAEVVVAGKTRVDLKKLMRILWKMGVRTLMLEGGGTLNGSMLDSGLVDDIYITIAPVVLGAGIRWVEGPLQRKTDLSYAGSKVLDGQVVLHYRVK